MNTGGLVNVLLFSRTENGAQITTIVLTRKKATPRKNQPQKANGFSSVCSSVMGKKLGQASALHGKLWSLWRQHVRRSAPCWLYVVITLTHILCCRVSEILALQKKDVDFRHRRVKIKALKKGPEVCILETRYLRCLPCIGLYTQIKKDNTDR